MRWTKRELKEIPIGSNRRKRRFLLWPKNIKGEVRWLEFAAWREEWIERKTGLCPIDGMNIPAPPGGWTIREWREVCWVARFEAKLKETTNST